MASGVKLVLRFKTSNDKNVIFSFNYAKSSATTAQVKNLMNGIITNGSIFTNVPVTAVSATQVVTEENEYDLS